MVAGAVLIIGTMTLSGIAITTTAGNADQTAAVAQAVRARPPMDAQMQEGEGQNQGEGQGNSAPANVPVPLDALRRICGLLPGVQAAIKGEAGKGGATSTNQKLPPPPKTTSN